MTKLLSALATKVFTEKLAAVAPIFKVALAPLVNEPAAPAKAVLQVTVPKFVTDPVTVIFGMVVVWVPLIVLSVPEKV